TASVWADSRSESCSGASAQPGALDASTVRTAEGAAVVVVVAVGARVASSIAESWGDGLGIMENLRRGVRSSAEVARLRSYAGKGTVAPLRARHVLHPLVAA